MAGIYIHIPFCKKRCSYCDFYKETDFSDADEIVSSICKEMQLRSAYLSDDVVKTVYLGGGTPSALDLDLLNQIFNSLKANFKIAPDAEISLEANPDDINSSFLDALEETPVNRLSMGVQTFNDDELKVLNRRHDATQALDAVNQIKNSRIRNFSLDLIYGLPGQSMDVWKQNVKQALALNPNHLSCYSLTYEKGTRLFEWRESRKVIPVNDETSLSMFQYLIKRAAEAGFEHYEISNFAKPGMRSKHNSSYWSGEMYLGLGPSAHSYNGKERSWNVSDNKAYQKAIEKGDGFSTAEVLNTTTEYNDFVITSLRTKEGISLQQVEERFGHGFKSYFLKEAQRFLSKGDLIQENEWIFLSKEGIFVSDGIMSDLLWVD